jgi:hypothetical protein
MKHDEFAALVEEANLAPSVHNTQPTRWRLDSDGSVLVFEDSSRRLPIGDPSGRDATVSHGAAIEGFSLACAARGWKLVMSAPDHTPDSGLRPVARLMASGGGPNDPLQALVRTRRTYRGPFVKGRDSNKLGVLTPSDDFILVLSPQGIARMALLNDEASLHTFRDGAYRAELLSWMRLSRSHPQWSLDGLNAEAMEMSSFQAAGAGLVLRPGVFETLDLLKIARLFVAEADVVRSAQAIVLFHRPEHENPLLTGRRFYRLWLEFTREGYSASPMAVLADDLEARTIITSEFKVPAEHRLITAFRIGAAPPRNKSPKPRLQIPSLIV